MTRQQEIIFIDNMETLGKTSITNIKKTIDTILDEYKGTNKQLIFLSSLTNVMLIEEDILGKAKEFTSLHNKEDKEKFLDEIDDLLNKKQAICKKAVEKYS